MDDILEELRSGAYWSKISPRSDSELSNEERASQLALAKKMLARFERRPRAGDEKFIAYWRERIERLS